MPNTNLNDYPSDGFPKIQTGSKASAARAKAAQRRSSPGPAVWLVCFVAFLLLGMAVAFLLSRTKGSGSGDQASQQTDSPSTANNAENIVDPNSKPEPIEWSQPEPGDSEIPPLDEVDNPDVNQATETPVEPDAPETSNPLGTAESPGTESIAVWEPPLDEEALFSLFEENALLDKESYPTLRTIFANEFASLQANNIEAELGAETSPLRVWLEEFPVVKEDLYLAIDPGVDNVSSALETFALLWKTYPDAFPDYASLAIAVSVVWDDNSSAIQRSPTGQHQSLSPSDPLGAIENFAYFVQGESLIGSRIRYMPWEFLLFTVDHKTPFVERVWSLPLYLPQRAEVGKCYKDVPYDTAMLGDSLPRLSGLPHTLPNLREWGGVCSAQADFASRVAKSIGVPAFQASGENRYGNAHAWVMWIQLQDVTENGFQFSLESYGRYRNDHYYVGNVTNPQSGRRSTDRELERYLRAVAYDVIAYRQTSLVMRAYPIIASHTGLDIQQQLEALDQIIRFSPGHDQSWRALASLCSSEEFDSDQEASICRAIDQLMITFAEFPDFTWTVFEDLIAWEEDPSEKGEMLGRLTDLYERAGRPDLACKARLRYAELLVEAERNEEAIHGLALTAIKFAEEGNFVPQLLSEIEKLSEGNEAATPYLADFYIELLPKLPEERGSAPSPYCIETYRRAIPFFIAANRNDAAAFYEAKIARLQGN